MQKTFRAVLETMGGRVAAGPGRGGGRGTATAQPVLQAPQTGQAGPQTGLPNAPAGQPASGGMDQRAANLRPPVKNGFPFHAAARSSTKSERCGWATTRRRARSIDSARPTT